MRSEGLSHKPSKETNSKTDRQTCVDRQAHQHKTQTDRHRRGWAYECAYRIRAGQRDDDAVAQQPPKLVTGCITVPHLSSP